MTAYRALATRARVQAGEVVLVTGIGGGVATCALLIAKHLGAKVYVTFIRKRREARTTAKKATARMAA